MTPFVYLVVESETVVRYRKIYTMQSLSDTTSTDESYMEVPLVVSCIKMMTLMLAPLVLATPTGLVLRVILKEESLHTKYYFIVSNLLVTDLLGVTVESLVQIIGLIMHVIGYQIDFNCALLKLLEIPTFASQLLLAILAIDRFTAITYPCQYCQIMNYKFAVGILVADWMMAVLTSLVIIYGMSFQYVPGFAQCHGLNGFPLDYFFKGTFMVITTVLMIVINVFLYNKIHETSARYREGMQLPGHGVHLRKATHLDTLKNHIKPTASILLLGGLDILFNLALHILSFFTLGNDLITGLYVTEFLAQPIKFCQLMCHPLVFAILITTIRSKIFDFELYHRHFSRQSKVIVLNRQWSTSTFELLTWIITIVFPCAQILIVLYCTLAHNQKHFGSIDA